MNIPVKRGELLADHTTFHIGGPAEYFMMVCSEEELVFAVSFAKENTLPITVIGGGSNILVSDDGLKGLVIKNCIKGITEEKNDDCGVVTAGAGLSFDELIAWSVDHEYWGLENLSFIPGSVGATPVQNVGAYGSEVSTLIQSVRVFDTTTSAFLELDSNVCQFAYRDSIFKHETGKKYIVTHVTYVLTKRAQPNISYKDLAFYFEDREPTVQHIRNAVIKIREGKFPDMEEVGTAGSFFKNPIITKKQYEKLCGVYPDLPGFPTVTGDIKVPLGWILDKICNLKGERHGAVASYENQALVLVSFVGATATDVTVFANEIQKKVLEKTNIEIEWEVTSL